MHYLCGKCESEHVIVDHKSMGEKVTLHIGKEHQDIKFTTIVCLDCRNISFLGDQSDVEDARITRDSYLENAKIWR